jgi:hypothetical protein
MSKPARGEQLGGVLDGAERGPDGAVTDRVQAADDDHDADADDAAADAAAARTTTPGPARPT